MNDDFALIVELEARLEQALAKLDAETDLRSSVIIALQDAEQVRDELDAIQMDMGLMSQELGRLRGVLDNLISRLSAKIARYDGPTTGDEGDDER